MYEMNLYCNLFPLLDPWENVDLSGSPLGCARQIPLAVAAFRVLSVWWKTSAFISGLFRVVLPHELIDN